MLNNPKNTLEWLKVYKQPINSREQKQDESNSQRLPNLSTSFMVHSANC